jgi:hypothetical protein
MVPRRQSRGLSGHAAWASGPRKALRGCVTPGHGATGGYEGSLRETRPGTVGLRPVMLWNVRVADWVGGGRSRRRAVMEKAAGAALEPMEEHEAYDPSSGVRASALSPALPLIARTAPDVEPAEETPPIVIADCRACRGDSPPVPTQAPIPRHQPDRSCAASSSPNPADAERHTARTPNVTTRHRAAAYQALDRPVKADEPCLGARPSVMRYAPQAPSR